jgi:cytoskeletal protein CcmA (bactofilin family)
MFEKKKSPAIKSLIAAGTRIEGHITFSAGLRVDGEIVGDIRSTGGDSSILVISESALVTGAVQSDHLIINGQITGPVHAGELLELQPKARIVGDVTYKGLEMHQGATIAGQLRPITGTGASEEEKPTLSLATNNG